MTPPGKPSCFVDADAPGGAYNGFDVFSAREPLAPGEVGNYSMPITITNEGAAYVTRVQVKCDTK